VKKCSQAGAGETRGCACEKWLKKVEAGKPQREDDTKGKKNRGGALPRGGRRNQKKPPQEKEKPDN